MANKHARRPPWWERAYTSLPVHGWQVFVGVCVFAAALLLFLDSRQSEQDEQVAYSQRDATAERALTLADQILAACQTGSIPQQYAGACNTAADVSADPIVLEGPPGEPGAPGERGPEGLRGEKGERGEPGQRGERGEKGDPGEPGERGERGQRGEQGPRGPAGEDGQDGVDGQPGRDGRDGDPGCLPGTQPEPYVWPDERTGSRCVEPEPTQESP